jgi:cell division protein FtsB
MEKEDRDKSSLRRKLILAAVGFFFLVLLISSFFGRNGLIEIYRARKNYAELLDKIKQLEARKSQLLREIEDLEKNPQTVEKEARDKLGLMKPDEKVVIKKNEEKR